MRAGLHTRLCGGIVCLRICCPLPFFRICGDLCWRGGGAMDTTLGGRGSVGGCS